MCVVSKQKIPPAKTVISQISAALKALRGVPPAFSERSGRAIFSHIHLRQSLESHAYQWRQYRNHGNVTMGENDVEAVRTAVKLALERVQAYHTFASNCAALTLKELETSGEWNVGNKFYQAPNPARDA